MPVTLAIGRRLSPTKAPPSIPTQVAAIPCMDLYTLRRAAEQAWENWRLCPEPVDTPVERHLWALHQAAEEALQVVVTDEQRRLGAPMDSATCGEVRGELLRRIGWREAQADA